MTSSFGVCFQANDCYDCVVQGQVVKEGQVICYVEQLGTQQPIEASRSTLETSSGCCVYQLLI
jgi:hypothetical protein